MVEMKKSWNIRRPFIGLGMARTVSGSACGLAKTSLILLAVALSVACGSLNARSGSSKSAGSRVYKFKSTEVTALLSTLAVDVRITDGGAAEAVVEMPSDEVAQCVVCELCGSALEIYPEENADRRVLSRIDAAHPIKVTICSSSFSGISTTAWSDIKCENSRFGSSFDINNTGQMNLLATNIRLADRLELNNTGTMRIAVRDIDAGRAVCINNTGSFEAAVRNIAAGSKFEINNTGAITLGADRYACKSWVDNNTGRTDITGRVEADRIECNSAGLERLSLDIACRKLAVYTSGSGDFVFRGCADDVDVASTGNARVSTREVE